MKSYIVPSYLCLPRQETSNCALRSDTDAFKGLMRRYNAADASSTHPNTGRFHRAIQPDSKTTSFYGTTNAILGTTTHYQVPTNHPTPGDLPSDHHIDAHLSFTETKNTNAITRHLHTVTTRQTKTHFETHNQTHDRQIDNHMDKHTDINT